MLLAAPLSVCLSLDLLRLLGSFYGSFFSSPVPSSFGDGVAAAAAVALTGTVAVALAISILEKRQQFQLARTDQTALAN